MQIPSINWALVLSGFKDIAVYVAGMVIFCIFTYSFHKAVARKFIFEFENRNCKSSKHPRLMQTWCTAVFIFKYLFFAPILLLLWFTTIAVLLFIFTRNVPIETLLILSMAFLSTIRITSYYDEALSRQIALNFPLSLLVVVLIDFAVIDFDLFMTKLYSLPALLPTLAIYFLFTVLLEFILRIYDAIATRE
jgi:hypothetical protein